MKNLAKRIELQKGSITTEEATKTAFIMPFFQMMGYDVFNPQEFVPEYTADVGIKKGEKVDFAIMENGSPLILIEAKSITAKLEKHDSQLFRYFGTTKAKLAILTNGEEYRFFSDLDEPNKMDTTPYFTLDFANLKDSHLTELAKYAKANFNMDKILSSASEMKYLTLMKNYLANEFENPSEHFTNLILSGVYDGKKTKATVERFTPIIRKSLKEFINDMVNDKLHSALNAVSTVEQVEASEPEKTIKGNIITTEEELEAYEIVKGLLKGSVDISRISYKDTTNYFGVLVDGSPRKYICRFRFYNRKKYVQFHGGEELELEISQISDLKKYPDKFKEALKQVL